jgi:class 3 adenylate cyclase/tetratricopeptide (TPR) repeat protein
LTATTRAARYAPYLPQLVRTWEPAAAYRELDATLVSVDLSGFTALSERLAGKGKAGAEELILVVSGCFEGLIQIAARHGGDVLKFRGDALLLLFAADGHAERACRAAAQMQWFINTAAPSRSSVGPVSLQMSTGVHSGTCHFFVAGTSHRELIVTGPAASETIRLESEASAGEVLVSEATAAQLDPTWVGPPRGSARLLRLTAAEVDDGAVQVPEPEESDGLADYVPSPLRAALATGVEPEHRYVVAAFVKYSGVESVLAERGAAELHARLAQLAEATGAAADDLGLTWLESDIDVDGGKLYLTAGAPASTGDDEGAMLHALRRIAAADTGLVVRAGANSGVAFAGDVGAATRRTYAVTGDTVNLAARLTARADAGEVLATAAVLDASATRYATKSKPLLVKGKERAITAYSVGDVIGGKAERAHELPLVGRDDELATFAGALDDARRRTSRLVELVGEPGMGKSRLLEELKVRAVGFQQLVASCEPYAASTPYGALHGLLRPLAGITQEMNAWEAGEQLKPWVEAIMPDLAPWLPLLAIPFNASVPTTPETDRIDIGFRHERLHDAVEQFLRRVLMMPSLIVVEDAHWLDDASAFLLRHLTRAQAPAPWLVVITQRPGGTPFVSESYGDLIELAPLAGDAATRLALSAAGDVALSAQELAAIAERAGGNPLFVCELVAAAMADGTVDALPQTVETLMTARIDTLEPSDRQLLRYAAVIGPTFELDLLEEVLADEIDDVAAQERWHRLAQFVSRDGATRLSFNHDLFRKTAYEGLSLRRRAELHGRVGAALERRAGDAADEAAALLSLHFLEAAEYEKAWRYGILAGHRAKQTLANVVAAELLERALAAASHLPDLPPRHLADIWESLGDVCEIFASYERAGDAYSRARSLVRDDDEIQARMLWKEGRQREWLGDYGDALGWYQRALARAAEHPETQVEIELAHASVRQRQGNFEEMAVWCERAIDHAQVAESKAGLAHAYYLLDMAHTRLGRPTTEYRHLALPIYEEIGDLLGQAKVLNNLGVDAYYEGRWGEAIELYDRCRAVAQQAGDVVYAAIATNNLAEILSDQGKLALARDQFEEARRAFRASKWMLGVPLVTSNLGRLAARDGRFDDAEELLREAIDSCRALGAETWVIEAEGRLAERHVLAGEFREAQVLAAKVVEAAAATTLGATAERALGYALVQARDPDAARPHFERSLEIGEAIGAGYEVALTLKALADTSSPELRERSRSLLDELGVVAVPEPPLP